MNSDDKLKELFDELKSEPINNEAFLRQLESNLKAMDTVKSFEASKRRSRRIPTIVAFTTGLVCGIVLSLLFPVMKGWISLSLIPHYASLGDVVLILPTVITSIIFSILILFITYSAYDISSQFVKSKN